MQQTLTSFEIDQLIEVVNIGAGNAATALSQMVDKKVSVFVPQVFIDRVEKVREFIGISEKVVTVVPLKILGDAPGVMFLMFPQESSRHMANILTKEHKNKIDDLDEFDRSALREMGNILAGASLSALSKFLDMSFLESVPEMATDMLGSVVDSMLAEIGQNSDIVVIFKAKFSVENENINGTLFFLFDPKSSAKILEKTKMKFHV